jgi:hypothetical protein
MPTLQIRNFSEKYLSDRNLIFLLWSAAVFYQMYAMKINSMLKFLFIIETFLHKTLLPPGATRHTGNLSLAIKYAAR